MTRLLVTLPEYDDTTFYCTKWCEKLLLPLAEKSQLDPIKLEKEKANKANLESLILSQNPKLVLLNGHGSNEAVFGHNNEPLIEVDKNEHLLFGKIVHAFSCSSAHTLGPKCVEKGTVAYTGYKNEFFFFVNTNKSARPLQDEIAKPVFEAALTLPLNLINGKTIREAFAKSQQKFDYWILYYRTHGELLETPQNILALMWDKNSQIIHGNQDATIFD